MLTCIAAKGAVSKFAKGRHQCQHQSSKGCLYQIERASIREAIVEVVVVVLLVVATGPEVEPTTTAITTTDPVESATATTTTPTASLLLTFCSSFLAASAVVLLSPCSSSNAYLGSQLKACEPNAKFRPLVMVEQGRERERKEKQSGHRSIQE